MGKVDQKSDIINKINYIRLTRTCRDKIYFQKWCKIVQNGSIVSISTIKRKDG